MAWPCCENFVPIFRAQSPDRVRENFPSISRAQFTAQGPLLGHFPDSPDHARENFVPVSSAHSPDHAREDFVPVYRARWQRKLCFDFQGTVQGTVPYLGTFLTDLYLGTFLTDLTMLERKNILISRAQSRARCPTWALSWPTWPCWTRPWRTWRRTGWSTLRSDARSLRCWHSSGCCNLLRRSTVWSSNPTSGSGSIPSESSLM